MVNNFYSIVMADKKRLENTIKSKLNNSRGKYINNIVSKSVLDFRFNHKKLNRT